MNCSSDLKNFANFKLSITRTIFSHSRSEQFWKKVPFMSHAFLEDSLGRQAKEVETRRSFLPRYTTLIKIIVEIQLCACFTTLFIVLLYFTLFNFRKLGRDF